MADPAAPPFAKTVSIDYSADELDALASAFRRADLARAPERAAGDPIERARHQTALRGLVARRAIVLSGTPARPRIALLDPHATLLGGWLGARAIATVRHEDRARTRVSSLHAAGVLVHQEALPGQAIERLTAHGAGAAPELLAAELRLPDGSSAEHPVPRLELTRRMIASSLEALAERRMPPERVPPLGADVLHARVASGSVSLDHWAPGGARTTSKWTWIDAGELGFWRVEAMPDDAIVAFVAAEPDALRAEIEASWATAAASAAGDARAG